MTGWTDADEELVAQALAAEDVNWGYDHGFGMDLGTGKPTAETAAFARAVLSALAAAGRDYTAGVIEGRRRAAEEFAAACAAEYDRLARTAIRCHQTGDHAEARIVAARQRTWRAASDLAAQIAEKGRADDR